MAASDNPVTKADLAAAVEEIKAYVREQVYDAETKLLRAFVDYSTNGNIRFQKLEADVSNINASSTQRLGSLESKVANLEMRLIRIETRTEIPPLRGEHPA